ncbi:c-type cytochrome [Flavobacterium sp. '19STA2R22 D10 B1']|uniref:c-type cytochrome n=1 Tax=Flavobacterium aerium TaxID=3037261 RepID=UPI00278BAE4C|nr:c-type cytochrome [Flavobacterium sp. '19STA2R22 D10 B1']
MKSFFKISPLFLLFLFSNCKKETPEKESLYPETVTEQSEQPTTSTPTDAAFPLANKGKEIFEGKGNCVACHLTDKTVIGPSIVEIAKIYKDKKGNIPAFLKGDGEPIVKPEQYEIMKTNFAITKMMSDEELQALSDYMYSQLK